MNKKEKINQVSGVLAILGGSVAMVGFILLKITFGYPEIIRAQPGVLLGRLYEMRSVVPYLYYIGIGGAGVSILFFSTLFTKICKENGEDVYSSLGKICGIIAGLLLYAGIIRYSILFPKLALLRETTNINKETIDLIFTAMNTYIGDSLAEHVQFTFTSFMLLFFGLSNLKTKILSKWISYFGIVTMFVLLIGNLEPFGFDFAFKFNRIGGAMIAIWLISVGIGLIRNNKESTVQA